MIRKSTISICLCICCTLPLGTLLAQDSLSRTRFLRDSLEKEIDSSFGEKPFFKPKSFWLADIDYLSNNVYFGRKDSILSPYLTASLGYYHKSGLFVNASASYLTKPGQGRIDLVTLDGGYSLITPKFEGQVTITKYFFSSESYNVRSEIEGSGNIFIAYDFDFIKPTFQGILNFGDNMDFATELGLEHTFYAMEKKLTITPTFNVNASTQNYYNNYYKFRRYALKKRKILQRVRGAISITAYIEDPGAFKILDYEWSIPVDYSIKKFTFTFQPTLAIPINPAIIDRTTTTLLGSKTKQTGKENLTNSFFITAGLSYSF